MNKRNFWRGLILAVLLVSLASSAFAASYKTLRYRDESSAVQQMQQALVSLGYSTGGVDGKFGPTTEKAVRQFQRDNGLTVDGLAGSKTLTLLYAKANGEVTSTPTAAPSTNTGTSSGSTAAGNSIFGGNYATLKYGSRGDRVKLLQQALNDLGFSAGSADGKFGTGTQRAVVAFQQANGLDADGKAGTKTLKKIEAQLAGDTGSDSVAPSAPTSAPAATPKPSTGSSYTVPTRTLRKGYQGEDVKSVQSRLKELGYYTGSIDGKYGSGSMAAVRTFQSKHGLTADGLAGTQTYKILFSDNAKPLNGATTAPTPTPTPTPTPAPSGDNDTGYEIPTRTLRKGYEGDDVKSVQRRLRELGYYKGSIDGKYGSGSMAAVKAFQQKNGLTADGLAGTNTYRVLYSDSAVPAVVTATPSPSPTPDPSSFTTLRKGSTGKAVQQLQNALVDLGYTVNTNGTYTSETATAVKAFQKANGLAVDGVAGVNTLTKLYSGKAVGPNSEATDTLPPGTGTGVAAPDKSQVQLLHWVDDIKPTLSARAHFLVYDPATGLSWTLQLLSAGRHADSEPLTATDTAVMFKAFGNQNTWTQKPVYVRLPDGRWTIGATHNTPHLSGNIKDNDFDGHLCLHFLRDMSEAELNDPKYGVSNQNTIRAFWKSLTGEDIPYK